MRFSFVNAAFAQITRGSRLCENVRRGRAVRLPRTPFPAREIYSLPFRGFPFAGRGFVSLGPARGRRNASRPAKQSPRRTARRTPAPPLFARAACLPHYCRAHCLRGSAQALLYILKKLAID